MLHNNWLKGFIGIMLCSTLLAGCAGTGSSVSGAKATVQSENRFSPDSGLDPNSPTYWLDYQTIYAPK